MCDVSGTPIYICGTFVFPPSVIWRTCSQLFTRLALLDVLRYLFFFSPDHDEIFSCSILSNTSYNGKALTLTELMSVKHMPICTF
jgi:hypothetical protein